MGDNMYSANIRGLYLKDKFTDTEISREGFIDEIDKALGNGDNDCLCKKRNSNDNTIAFLFTGQGSIYKGIAKDFYTTSKPFREVLDLCNEKFKAIIGISLLDAIYGDDSTLIDIPLYSQPIIFSIEYALTKLWDISGVKPKVVIGHSIGEYVAACYAGLISLDDAIMMIAQRGRIMTSIDIDGKMIGILSNVDNVKAAIEESLCKNVSIAAVNAPENVTISGLSNEVDTVVTTFQKKHRVFISKLSMPRPYHSPLMGRYVDDYDKNIGEIKFSSLKVDMISSISGKLEKEEVLGTRKYWVEHITKTVDFQSAILEAEKFGVNIFIEIGGDSTLSGLTRQCLKNDKISIFPSLRKCAENHVQIFESVSALLLKGIDHGTME